MSKRNNEEKNVLPLKNLLLWTSKTVMNTSGDGPVAAWIVNKETQAAQTFDCDL